MIDEEEREKVRIAGHRRCVAEDCLNQRAMTIVEHYAKETGLGYSVDGLIQAVNY